MNILIVKTSALGDAIHVFPVIQLLRKKYPHARIDWVVEESLAELVRAHPCVDNVFTIQSRKWRKSFWKKEGWQAIQSFRHELQRVNYDYVYDLQGNVKSGVVTWLAQSPIKVGFAYDSVPEWPNLLFTNRRFSPPKGNNIRDDYLYLVDQETPPEIGGVQLKISPKEQNQIELLLASPCLIREKKVMVCPGSIWTNKQMTQEGLVDFLQTLYREVGARFLFAWGSQREKQIVETMALKFPGECVVMDRLSLPALQNVMGRVDLVISMDSLPLHLAGTTQTPTYGIFGASSASKYKPVGSQAYQGKCPYGKRFDKRCPILRTCPTGCCIKSIKTSPLFNDFIVWWTGIKRSKSLQS